MNHYEANYTKQRVRLDGGFRSEDEPEIWCYFWTHKAAEHHAKSEDWFPFEPFVPFEYDQGEHYCPIPTFFWELPSDTSLQELYDSIIGDIRRSDDLQSFINQAISKRDALEKQLRRAGERLDEVFQKINPILKVWLVEAQEAYPARTADIYHAFSNMWEAIIAGKNVDELLERVVTQYPCNVADGQRVGVQMYLQSRDFILEQTTPFYDRFQVYEAILFQALQGLSIEGLNIIDHVYRKYDRERRDYIVAKYHELKQQHPDEAEDVLYRKVQEAYQDDFEGEEVPSKSMIRTWLGRKGPKKKKSRA